MLPLSLYNYTNPPTCMLQRRRSIWTCMSKRFRSNSSSLVFWLVWAESNCRDSCSPAALTRSNSVSLVFSSISISENLCSLSARRSSSWPFRTLILSVLTSATFSWSLSCCIWASAVVYEREKKAVAIIKNLFSLSNSLSVIPAFALGDEDPFQEPPTLPASLACISFVSVP